MTFNLSAVAGGSNPASQTVRITNTGWGTLRWSASVSAGAPWLSISSISGTAPSAENAEENEESWKDIPNLFNWTTPP